MEEVCALTESIPFWLLQTEHVLTSAVFLIIVREFRKQAVFSSFGDERTLI